MIKVIKIVNFRIEMQHVPARAITLNNDQYQFDGVALFGLRYRIFFKIINLIYLKKNKKRTQYKRSLHFQVLSHLSLSFIGFNFTLLSVLTFKPFSQFLWCLLSLRKLTGRARPANMGRLLTFLTHVHTISG